MLDERYAPLAISLSYEEAGKLKRAVAGKKCAWARDTISEESPSKTVRSIAEKMRRELGRVGYSVLSLPPEISEGDGSAASNAVNLMVTGLVEPIRVFKKDPSHWRELFVDIDRPARRSRGVGSLPLHQDFVNAMWPPDYVCMYCRRPDPLGGGETILAGFEGIVKRLRDPAFDVLSERRFVDGRVHDLANVGEDINPFAVVNPGKAFTIRYTGHLLDSANGEAEMLALTELSELLSRTTTKYRLGQGDLLVIDQRRALHGRSELGGDQRLLPENERRLVMLSYGRRRD
ncbi:MAG: hypothetical protein QOC65_1483 [Sphingomonadales bacterium]|nr:hypothetical protein [Sphingomonadales bacterium]